MTSYEAIESVLHKLISIQRQAAALDRLEIQQLANSPMAKAMTCSLSVPVGELLSQGISLRGELESEAARLRTFLAWLAQGKDSPELLAKALQNWGEAQASSASQQQEMAWLSQKQGEWEGNASQAQQEVAESLVCLQAGLTQTLGGVVAQFNRSQTLLETIFLRTLALCSACITIASSSLRAVSMTTDVFSLNSRSREVLQISRSLSAELDGIQSGRSWRSGSLQIATGFVGTAAELQQMASEYLGT